MLQPVTQQNFQQMLGRFTTAELEDLVEKFPSFQQAYVLLAKKYQQENNPKFDQQLQLAALYTQDRELLYSLFNEQDLTEPATSQEIIFKENTGLESAFVETNVLQIEETEETEETVKDEPFIEKEKEPETEAFSQDEPHTFEDWLKAFSPTPPETEEKTEEPDKELNQIIMENSPVGYLHELVEEETHYSKGLEKFIEEQIEKRKHEPATSPPTDDIDPELITETMAKIYEMQKKYARAIKAYEILALKNPEKSGYFAARINYLKSIS